MKIPHKIEKILQKATDLLTIKLSIDKDNRIVREYNRKNRDKKTFKPRIEKEYPGEVFHFFRSLSLIKSNLTRRTPNEWIKTIERRIPESRRCQVASIVFWDYYGNSKKRVPQFYPYVDRMELQTQEQTVIDLIEVGYPAQQAYARCDYKEPAMTEAHL